MTLAEALERVKPGTYAFPNSARSAATHIRAPGLTTLLHELTEEAEQNASILIRPECEIDCQFNLRLRLCCCFHCQRLPPRPAFRCRRSITVFSFSTTWILTARTPFLRAGSRAILTIALGAAFDAAGLLFSEFHRLGVLESQFFEDDKKFENRPKLSPDPVARARFDAEIQKAQAAARARLATNAKDKDALFAMTLTNGLQADYAALVEKRNLASLHYTKEATVWGTQTLAVDHDCYDAHIAGGISKYIVGSMSAPVRWLVRLGGVSGDKQAGIQELKLVADRGHYLAPFANILLAIAYARDHDRPRARELLASLQVQFPSNPLFAEEIARLDSGH